LKRSRFSIIFFCRPGRNAPCYHRRFELIDSSCDRNFSFGNICSTSEEFIPRFPYRRFFFRTIYRRRINSLDLFSFLLWMFEGEYQSSGGNKKAYEGVSASKEGRHYQTAKEGPKQKACVMQSVKRARARTTSCFFCRFTQIWVKLTCPRLRACGVAPFASCAPEEGHLSSSEAIPQMYHLPGAALESALSSFVLL